VTDLCPPPQWAFVLPFCVIFVDAVIFFSFRANSSPCDGAGKGIEALVCLSDHVLPVILVTRQAVWVRCVLDALI
jgi:hypothetical protein